MHFNLAAGLFLFMLSQSPVVNAFSGIIHLFYYKSKLSHLIISLFFKECRNSNLPDPDIPGVTNCQQWLAYASAVKGVNIVHWCSDTANFQKCCLTCESNLKFFVY